MKRTNTLPFFQVDSGQLLYESMGMTLEQVGIYALLMAMYWENECRLPPRETLVRKLKMTPRKAVIMDGVIDTFFPDGVHTNLDQCRENALKTSARNSQNVSQRYKKPAGIGGKSQKFEETSSDPHDF